MGDVADLREAFAVVDAWDFEYKSSFVWDKIKHVMGHYNSVRHEFLLICTRGSCQPDTLQLIDSVQSIERKREHSEKPVEFYDIIETLYTYGRKLEMFPRGRREGWDVYGHQAQIAKAADSYDPLAEGFAAIKERQAASPPYPTSRDATGTGHERVAMPLPSAPELINAPSR